jgi:hypothetical protein
VASGEKQFSDLTEVQTVTGKVGESPQARTLRLHLTLFRPTGTVAAEQVMDWHNNRQSVGALGWKSTSAQSE